MLKGGKGNIRVYRRPTRGVGPADHSAVKNKRKSDRS